MMVKHGSFVEAEIDILSGKAIKKLHYVVDTHPEGVWPGIAKWWICAHGVCGLVNLEEERQLIDALGKSGTL